MKLGVVIPACNEEKVIGSVVESIPAALSGVAARMVIVVDDGSSDATASVAARSGALVLKHLLNRGQGAAVQTGIEAARRLGCDLVVTLDGDGQHRGEDIQKLLDPLLADRADIVNGSRFLKQQDIPLMRRVYNFFANCITWMMSGFFLTDSQSGMKAFGPKALKEIQITANRYEFCTEIIREASVFKLRVQEVPIDVIYTPYTMRKGQSFAVGLNTIFKLAIRSVIR